MESGRGKVENGSVMLKTRMVRTQKLIKGKEVLPSGSVSKGQVRKVVSTRLCKLVVSL
jgi:hypothetical protein